MSSPEPWYHFDQLATASVVAESVFE